VRGRGVSMEKGGKVITGTKGKPRKEGKRGIGGTLKNGTMKKYSGEVKIWGPLLRKRWECGKRLWHESTGDEPRAWLSG